MEVMPNYRGGEIQQSGYYAALEKAIREGRTEAQKQRDFRKKLMMAGVQAGLTTGSAVAHAVKSYRDENAETQARGDAAEKRAREALEPNGVPAWLGGHGEGDASATYSDPEPREQTDLRLTQPDGLGESRSGVPVGQVAKRTGGMMNSLERHSAKDAYDDALAPMTDDEKISGYKKNKDWYGR